MFEAEQAQIEQQIRAFFTANDLPEPALNWGYIPFNGQWGISTSFFQSAANEARQGKKINVSQRAVELAQQVAGTLGLPAGFERVEAVKGYLNLYFKTGEYTRRGLWQRREARRAGDGRVLSAQHTQGLSRGAPAQRHFGRCAGAHPRICRV
jgi:arginyl-tRNA synthetase